MSTAKTWCAVRSARGEPWDSRSQRSFFPRLTAGENLEFFAALEDVPRNLRRQRVAEVLQSTELLEQADMLVMKFSSGMYQKLGIARALLKNPSVLLADEPSRSLDPGAAAHLWKLLRALTGPRTTVVLTTHNFAEAAAVADAMAVLRGGVLMAHRELDHAGIDELRAYYFRHVASGAEAPDGGAS